MNNKVQKDNYVVIQGWMISDLKLKGNELIVYAIIWGFSQLEGQLFNGSLQYLADWTNSTKQGVSKNLKSLVEKGLVGKNDKIINKVKYCEYYATKFNGGMQQSLTPPIQQSLTNNIDLDNKKERKKEKKSGYDEIINTMVQDENVKNTIYEFIKMRKLIKKPMTDRALTMLINKLNKLSLDKEIQIKILEKSILKNWTDIYEYKDGDNEKPKSSSGRRVF